VIVFKDTIISKNIDSSSMKTSGRELFMIIIVDIFLKKILINQISLLSYFTFLTKTGMGLS